MRKRTAVIQLPGVIEAKARGARSAVQAVIDEITRHLAIGAKVTLDFRHVYSVRPGGMLVLLAFVERRLVECPGCIRARCKPGSLPAQLLRQFGYGTSLGVPAGPNLPTSPSVVRWRHATGHHVDGAAIHAAMQHLETVVGDGMPDGLYEVLTEAVTNTVHHAYDPREGAPGVHDRWWVFLNATAPDAQARTSGSLFVAAYDMGVGIPARMRERLEGASEKVGAAFESVARWAGVDASSSQDCRLLQAAVDGERTSSGLPFRGKGLPEMKEFVVRTQGGEMTIMAGDALYTFRHGWDQSRTQVAERLAGTLILWRLPLRWQEITP